MIDRICLWVLCIGVFGLPLIYLRDVHDEFVLPKVLFANVLIASLLALHAIRWASAGAVEIRRTALDLPILAFLGSAVISTVFSENRNVAIFGTYGRYEGLLTLVAYASLFWLATQTIREGEQAWTVLRVMLASAYVVSIIAVVQWVVAALTTIPPHSDTGFSYAGLPRASATMSNPTMLAVFLAMLFPIAAMQFFDAQSLTTRILTANIVLTMSLALALTFVRLAWLGAVAGLAIAVAAPQRTSLRRRFAFIGGATFSVLGILAAGFAIRGGLPLVPSLLRRLASIGVGSGSGLTRLHVWSDAIHVIASRPVVGYGPDSFGIVDPRYRSGDWAPGFIIDKVPSDVLQVAATMGLLGVVSYLWILVASVAAFWRCRRNPGAAAAFGGLVAYELWAQANFSWFPATSMFWIFLAAAVCIWARGAPYRYVFRFRRLAGLAVALPLATLLLGFGIFTSVRSWAADTHYQAGLNAEARGDRAAARRELEQARSLGPQESQYAFEAGRVDFASSELGERRWSLAREALTDAGRLGTYYGAVYYDLALCDIQLGRRTDAIAALNEALQLSPGDPPTLALLRQIKGS